MDSTQREIVGYVVSGRGNANQHIQEEYESFCVATNEKITPGSLNILFDEPIFFDPKKAKIVSGGKRLLWKAHLLETPVWIYRFPHAPLHIAEILSSDHLRSLLNLGDGDKVSLYLPENYCLGLSFRQRAAWKLLWKGRESWCYHRESYYRRALRLSVDLGATQISSQKSVFRSLIEFVRRAIR